MLSRTYSEETNELSHRFDRLIQIAQFLQPDDQTRNCGAGVTEESGKEIKRLPYETSAVVVSLMRKNLFASSIFWGSGVLHVLLNLILQLEHYTYDNSYMKIQLGGNVYSIVHPPLVFSMIGT